MITAIYMIFSATKADHSCYQLQYHCHSHPAGSRIHPPVGLGRATAPHAQQDHGLLHPHPVSLLDLMYD